MLIKTHVVFSAGLLLFIGALITHEPGLIFVYTLTVSAVANVLIDRLGHETVNINGKLVPRRTPLTHTWFRSALGFISFNTPVTPPVLNYVRHVL